MKQARHHPNGFVLIELVMILILVGFIGAFAGLFLFKGVEGFIASKSNSEGALKAQIAIDRISAELKHVTEITNWTGASFTYKSLDFPKTTRKLVWDSAAHEIRLSINNGPERVLIDQVQTCTFAREAIEIDRASDNKEEIKSVTVKFTLNEVGRPFEAKIFPRRLVANPA
jgi:hypothetical protein